MLPGESFHPSLLAFLFDWWTKRWEIAEDVSMNCTAFTYYVTLIAKRTWLYHPLKLLLSTLLSCTDSSQPGWFYVETYTCFVGLWYVNTAGAIKQVCQIIIDWKIVSSCTDSRHWLPNMQHFMLEQIDLYVFLPVIYQQQLLLCVNKRLKTSIVKY